MFGNNTKYVFSAATLLGVAGGAYYLLNRNNLQNNSTNYELIPKEKVVKILNDFNKELFQVFTSVSMIGLQIREQSRGKIPTNELKELLLNQPHLKQEIALIEQSIYQSNQVSERDFKNACLVTYAQDKFLINQFTDKSKIYNWK